MWIYLLFPILVFANLSEEEQKETEQEIEYSFEEDDG